MNRIQEIKGRRSKITPAPWHAPGLGEVHCDHGNNVYVRVYAEDDPRHGTDESIVADGCAADDAEFIAHAPDDMDFLLAEVERLSKTKETEQL